MFIILNSNKEEKVYHINPKFIVQLVEVKTHKDNPRLIGDYTQLWLHERQSPVTVKETIKQIKGKIKRVLK